MFHFLFRPIPPLLLATLLSTIALSGGKDLPVPYSAPLLANAPSGKPQADGSNGVLELRNAEGAQGLQTGSFTFDLSKFPGRHTPSAIFKFCTDGTQKSTTTPVVELYASKDSKIDRADAPLPGVGKHIASLVGRTSDTVVLFDFDVTDYINSQLAIGNRKATIVAVLGGKPGAYPPISIFSKKSARPAQLLLQPENTPAYSEEACLRPFWTSEVIHEEPVLPMAKEGARPEGSLLFDPEEILSVRSYATGQEFHKGKDWVLEGNKIVLPEGSSAPSVTLDDVYPDKPRSDGRFFDKLGGGKIFSPEGQWFAERNILVTYKKKKNATWKGPVPRFAGPLLPGTSKKLQEKAPLTIVLIGDSISMRANSSRSSGQPPHMPSWGMLVASSLRAHYGGPVIFKNHALGGMNVNWGAANAESLVAAEKPDLCIIAFGMNDRTSATPDQFVSQIKKIMESARSGNPACEFILVSSMLCNELWASQQPLYDFRTKLLSLEGPGVAVADVTSLHAELLKTKKYLDMTGNNVNHPNDYLIRWYAQALNAALIP